MKHVNIFLFDDFTMLDAFGPAEVFGRLKEKFKVNYFSLDGGEVFGSSGVKVTTEEINGIPENDILVVPGGWGTRKLVDDRDFIKKISEIGAASEYVLSICTGSALLAKAGLLDGKRATSNKMAWDWVISRSDKVKWIRRARWVVDGKFYTSSGVTAGIDMTLGFIHDTVGSEIANSIAKSLEYIWNSDREQDNFA